MMEYLNDDAIAEILANLPVKSLLRFRSVCKLWRSIIDSSVFRKSHFENHQMRNKSDDEDILFLQLTKEELTWQLSSTLSLHDWRLGNDFSPGFQNYLKTNIWDVLIIDGPVNGLICMYNEGTLIMEHLGVRVSIAVCNPCLGVVKILPISDSLNDCARFDQRFCYWCVGFGFDSVRKEYKVVQLICYSWDEGVHAEVYSGGTNSWKVVNVGHIFDSFRVDEQIKTSGGAVAYWLCTEDDDDGDFDSNKVILAFDMHTEVFEMIRLPKFEQSWLFAKDDGTLVLFAYAYTKGRRMEVREMERGRGRGWSHLRDINLQFDTDIVPPPIALWKYGVIFTSYAPNIKEGEELVFYDYTTERERKRVHLPKPLGLDLLIEYKCTLNTLETCLI